LLRPEAVRWDDRLLSLNGFASPNRPPDHIVMSPGVDVTIYPLQRVG
jgi:hypothetical protein